jgi:hypothetical protein
MDFEKQLKEIMLGYSEIQRQAWMAGYERGKIEGRMELARELAEKEEKELKKVQALDNLENEQKDF